MGIGFEHARFRRHAVNPSRHSGEQLDERHASSETVSVHESALIQAKPMDAQRVLAIVITYRPMLGLLDNLFELNRARVRTVVVDNTDDSSSCVILEKIERELPVRVIRNGQNLGIAAALNIGVRQAIDEGFEWVATFDQDSLITQGYFKLMFEAYELCSFQERVALIAPLLCYSSEESNKQRQVKAKPLYSLTRTAMSSGSLIRSEIFKKEGFYDESFFMDYVDYEFCLRLWKRGWKIIRANRAHLLHKLGVPRAHSFLGLKLTTKSHNPWRRYFIMRNRVIVFQRYGFSSPAWCLYDFFWIFLELTKIVFFEKERGAQLRATVRGLRDGLRRKAAAPA